MANENPTGRDPAVVLTIPADQVCFLRRVFEMARDGVRDELAQYPDQLREPSRLRREEAVYGRLLVALDEHVVVPDRDVRAVLGDLAQIIDADNEYRRVVAEHEALHGLLGQIEGSAGPS
jgi:hypothetical protein